MAHGLPGASWTQWLLLRYCPHQSGPSERRERHQRKQAKSEDRNWVAESLRPLALPFSNDFQKVHPVEG